ncbi:hypothetical protein ACT17_23080 [Mycolicibacterium conceptionense]|uniref:Uncharacterized protein n=1 Tax=Mycolicibacterium conceptionense TaxID=451644 RepID=A0A0J8U384_9MYCO|nr:hypothetical protein [Mycolicibacterium conceptionense]KMV15976.1 hypothetical protein ACT17_23080 [Mycolicibacterium conceptionense]
MTATFTTEDDTRFWPGLVELARSAPAGFIWFTGQVIVGASVTTYAAWTATTAIFETPGVERFVPVPLATAAAVTAAVGLWTTLYVIEVVDAIHGLPSRWKANRPGGLALRPRLALVAAVGLMTAILAAVVLFWIMAVALPDFADHIALDMQWLVYPGEGVQGVGMLTIPDGTPHTFLSPSTTVALTALALAAGGWVAKQCFELATPHSK